MKGYESYKNCEVDNNSPYRLQNQRNSFKGLQGRPIERKSKELGYNAVVALNLK